MIKSGETLIKFAETLINFIETLIIPIAKIENSAIASRLSFPYGKGNEAGRFLFCDPPPAGEEPQVNTTDWEIHRLERAVVRLQPREAEEDDPSGAPTVEAMLGMASSEGKLERERKQALDEIETILYRKKAGRAGEEIVEQTLSEVIFPEGTRVYRNVSLQIRKGYQIEIDVLILTPSFVLILEVKNIAGTLVFNEDEGKTV